MQQSRAITRRSASNLALAFCLLPKPKRDDMSALYAFCREVDDVADEDSTAVERRREQLAAWREDIRRACTSGQPEFPVNRELKPAIERYHLPFELFDELIQGCEMDLDTQRYATWEQLDLYCHRVASVVGLLSIEIFEYKDPACRDYAVALGKALQLTNILRDVRTDAARGRIYLPLAELKRCCVTENEILENKSSPRVWGVAAAVAERAKCFYRQARKTLPAEDRRAMIAAELMGAVYWRLLRKIERRGFNIFAVPPTRLSKPCKLGIILRTWCRFAAGATASDYGDV
jgi:phytoene synthase